TLSVVHHLRGLDNFDEWHFELTTIVLQGEGLTTQATQCTGVEAKWSIKGLTCAFRVLDGDTKKLRRHIDDAVLRPSSEPPLPPPVLDDVAPKLIDPIMEYLAEHRSAKFLEARAAKAALEYLLKSEHADVERSIVLVYASLSEAVRRDAAVANLGQCAHCIIEWLRGKFCSEEQKFASAVDVYTKFHGFKFERYCSLDGSLATFDKLRKAVEKRESTTLSDSHLASVLLSALPDCIAHDVQVWRGARPSIPYTQLRELLPQHWHELTQKYPDFLGPKPTAHAVPVHGSGQAPETTRSSALRLSSYDGYGQTTGLSPWRSQRDMPREDRGYCLAHAGQNRGGYAHGGRSQRGYDHAVIPTAATPKAANKESRLRADAINVTKVRFATTAIATTRAIAR
ncbi:hypothetical protein DYB28_014454, partial [Aphanomyces astaci]